MNSSTLSLSDFEIRDSYSYQFNQTLCGHDQNKNLIGIFHVWVNPKDEKPSINDNYPKGKTYLVSECNTRLNSDFKTLLNKNLILLHDKKNMQMFAFLGFEKYGKINKHSKFYGGKLREYSNISSSHLPTRVNNDVLITKFKLMDYQTSECLKKTLSSVAWMCNNASNNISENQYNSIPNNTSLYKIQQTVQPIFTQTTSLPSRTKALPTLPPKPSNNTTSSSANINSFTSFPPISTTPTNSFKSLNDFQGNNFDKDPKIPAAELLKIAIEFAKKDGYTNFAIANSFNENNAEVFAEVYFDSETKDKCHKAKVNFYVDANNGFGKNCRLILQRQFFCYSPDPEYALKKIAKASNKIQESV
ncbi:MAG: hypothetical protein H0V82_00320 [Candidatus Protochlamydia sp.]|nr:hypothetical protein [Candidatus Protochlamydia sp.]